MSESNETQTRPPGKVGRPADWREQIRADLAGQVQAGATLYGVRPDGAYLARTRDGDRIIGNPARQTP